MLLYFNEHAGPIRMEGLIEVRLRYVSSCGRKVLRVPLLMGAGCRSESLCLIVDPLSHDIRLRHPACSPSPVSKLFSYSQFIFSVPAKVIHHRVRSESWELPSSMVNNFGSTIRTRQILHGSGELFGMALSPGPCEDSSWATAVFRFMRLALGIKS